jgi:hypothetical protein
MPTDDILQVREVLQKFQDGYYNRDKSKLDDFMGLFVPTDEIEQIGVGTSKHGGNEWFNGKWGFHTIHWLFPGEKPQ